MRTEFAWMYAFLNANHFSHMGDKCKNYDHVFIIIKGKGKLNLNAEGTKIENK